MTLIKIYILVAYTHVYLGHVVSFQEFTSYESCQKNATYLNTLPDVQRAYCTEK